MTVLGSLRPVNALLPVAAPTTGAPTTPAPAEPPAPRFGTTSPHDGGETPDVARGRPFSALTPGELAAAANDLALVRDMLGTGFMGLTGGAPQTVPGAIGRGVALAASATPFGLGIGLARTAVNGLMVPDLVEAVRTNVWRGPAWDEFTATLTELGRGLIDQHFPRAAEEAARADFLAAYGETETGRNLAAQAMALDAAGGDPAALSGDGAATSAATESRTAAAEEGVI